MERYSRIYRAAPPYINPAYPVVKYGEILLSYGFLEVMDDLAGGSHFAVVKISAIPAIIHTLTSWTPMPGTIFGIDQHMACWPELATYALPWFHLVKSDIMK